MKIKDVRLEPLTIIMSLINTLRDDEVLTTKEILERTGVKNNTVHAVVERMMKGYYVKRPHAIYIGNLKAITALKKQLGIM